MSLEIRTHRPNRCAAVSLSCLILPPNHLRRSVVGRHTSTTTLRAGPRDSDILHYLTYTVRNHAQRSLLVLGASISVAVDFYPTRAFRRHAQGKD